jgi:hypothetical protein
VPPALRLTVPLLFAAVLSAACSKTESSTPTSPTTPTPSTPAPTNCTYTVSPTSISAAPAGGSSTVTVTTQTGCAWTASTSASFITITSGASGTGSGSVTLSVAADSGHDRTGTVTVAGSTVTVTQTGEGLIAAFDMYDPPSQGGPTAVCRIKGGGGNPPTSCPLLSTSRPTLSNYLVNWAWTIKYTYDGQDKIITQSSPTITQFAVSDFCGLNPSSKDGVNIPLSVSLTVTDNNGIQATATSGSGNQPAMVLVAYTCGS